MATMGVLRADALCMLRKLNFTYHFIVNFMEMDFTHFVNNVLTLKGDKSKAPVTVGLFIKHEHGIFNLQKRKEMVTLSSKEEL